MMYNDFIKDMTDLKKFRKILKIAEKEVIKQESQLKARKHISKQKLKINEERKLLEQQLAALNVK